jgi:SepF-like predicted cell division protein (DUF552 family)
MGLKSWIRKMVSEKGDETIQFDECQHDSKEKLNVRIDYLMGAEDVDRVAKLVREGNIMLLKIKDLQKKDIGLLQNTVQKLKRICSQSGWDVVGLEDGYLVVTPQFAKIER